jgi:D-sedoheptulose 7-phosphate isomerase
LKQSTQVIVNDLIIRYSELTICYEGLVAAIEVLIDCYKNGNKLLTCGNGGSASDAQHIVGELMKAFVLPRNLSSEKQKQLKEMFPKSSLYLIKNLQVGLPAISLLGEASLTSAYANDTAPDLVFAQQVLGLGRKGDVLLAISTSGNSQNILYACEVASVQNMKIIGLTGETGSKMKDLCDVLISVPSKTTYKIQEFHLPVYHCLCLALENEFFGEDN